MHCSAHGCCLLAALAAGAAAQAQTRYPVKSIRLIVPFAAGGASDKSELAKWTRVFKEVGLQGEQLR